MAKIPKDLLKIGKQELDRNRKRLPQKSKKDDSRALEKNIGDLLPGRSEVRRAVSIAVSVSMIRGLIIGIVSF